MDKEHVYNLTGTLMNIRNSVNGLFQRLEFNDSDSLIAHWDTLPPLLIETCDTMEHEITHLRTVAQAIQQDTPSSRS